MKQTVSLKLNREFRRLYQKGKSAVDPFLAVYCRKNRLGFSRLGLTVGTKVGHAVVRNRARRRLREVCRLAMGQLKPGYDLVVVARGRCLTAPFQQLRRQYEGACRKLGIWGDGT